MLAVQRSKVKWKIMLSMTVFAVITLLSLWLYQYVFLGKIHSQIRTMTVNETADKIARVIDTSQLKYVVQEETENNDLCIRIFDSSGKDLFRHENESNCEIHGLGNSDIQRYYKNSIENDGAYIEQLNRIYIIRTQVVNTEHGQFFMILGSSLLPLESTTQTLKYQFVILGIGFLVMALFLTWNLSRTISKPIAQLNTEAKRLAKGDYDVRFDGKGYVEVEELSETLNYATKELQKLDTLKNELIANISHDLRTPLTLITGYGEVMRDIPGENTPENIQVIIDESKRLSEIVNELLDLSKLRSGEIQLKQEQININEFTQKIYDRYRKLTGLEGYNIVFQNETIKDYYVRADMIQLERVVSNLVNNAINYTGNDKKVIIRQSVREENNRNRVRVEIIDSGKGIPKEELPYIWERYYRANEEHSRASVGSGLGLSIVKVLLDLHGAKYGVISGTSGSVFWFELECFAM